jgi:hypothetical protein
MDGVQCSILHIGFILNLSMQFIVKLMFSE